MLFDGNGHGLLVYAFEIRPDYVLPKTKNKNKWKTQNIWIWWMVSTNCTIRNKYQTAINISNEMKVFENEKQTVCTLCTPCTLHTMCIS